MDGDIYLLFLLLLLILLPLLLFIVLSLLKWYQIRQLIKRFKPLNQPSGTSVPIQFSWMDVLFTQYSPSNLLLYSSNESIFHIRTKYSQNKPVYITYTRQQYTSLFPRISSIRFLTPYYVVITNLQIAKQVLEDSERWIKVGRQNTGVLASLMSLACTSMSKSLYTFHIISFHFIELTHTITTNYHR